ncbi:MAG: tetratricopeptide repeat protein [Gemmatimonadota bacterium]
MRPTLPLALLLLAGPATAQVGTTPPRWPTDSAALDSAIWAGRRLGYQGTFAEAVAVYSTALGRWPDEPRLLRHRGHRHISQREYARAVADLTRAADRMRGWALEVEPDGQPNAKGIPVSTLQFNVWYHLGLAEWLRGDARRALAAYEQCLAVSRNDDSRVAARYWLWQILMRLGRRDDAAAMARAARTETDLIENQSYARLLALFDGRATPTDLAPAAGAAALDDVTLGYGIGAWHRAHGRIAEARTSWERVVNGSGPKAAFGALAAREELARLP